MYGLRAAFPILLILMFPAVNVESAVNDSFIVCPSSDPNNPIQKGIDEIERVLENLEWRVTKRFGSGTSDAKKQGIEIVVATFSKQWARSVEYDILKDVVPSEHESYSVLAFPNPTGLRIYAIGIDDTGTMYAALDVAEQLWLGQFRTVETVQIKEKKKSPSILYRGIHLFIHTQALDDPVSWFHNEKFWHGFFLQMAKSRFNLLDLHGAYDLITTQYPNLLPYMVSLPKYPDVGVGPEKAQRNLSSLHNIIEMAHEYGIKVCLMNYSASWSIPDHPGSEETEEGLRNYTIAALKKVLETIPSLDGLGFRVGESGQTMDFYRAAYLNALSELNMSPALFTRTWMAKEKEIFDLADVYPGNTVLEIKYNGEHLGLPYLVTGGRMTEWPGYSYENYLKLPRKYAVLYQIESNGAHRIFPWGDVDFIRQALKSTTYCEANGFILNTYSTYYPHSDAYTNTTQTDLRYYNWTYERDWFWFLLWGRLAYDLNESEQLFKDHFQHHFNSNAGILLYEALKKASKVIPTITSVFNPGPSKRSFAPELDPPQQLSQFLNIQPLDVFAIRSISEEARAVISGIFDGRRSPLNMMVKAVEEAERAVSLAYEAETNIKNSFPEGTLKTEFINRYRECKSWLLDFQALSALARCYLDKISAAINLGIFIETGDVPSLMIASERIRQCSSAWNELSRVTNIHYRPFIDTLRHGTTQFHWNMFDPKVQEDIQELTVSYNNWLQSWRENPKLGHLPTHKVPPQQPVLITVSIPSTLQADNFFVDFQNSAGVSGRLKMEPAKIEGVYYTEIPSRNVQEGGLQYYIYGSVGGRSVSTPGQNEEPYRIMVTSDNTPPQVIDFEHSVTESKTKVSITGEFKDSSGIAVARIIWKPLPSRELWSESVMKRIGDVFTGSFPLTPSGAQFSIEIMDRFSNSNRIPDIRNGIPYQTVPPFPSRR